MWVLELFILSDWNYVRAKRDKIITPQMTQSKGSFKVPQNLSAVPVCVTRILMSSSITTRQAGNIEGLKWAVWIPLLIVRSSTQKERTATGGVYMILFVKPAFTMSFKNICTLWFTNGKTSMHVLGQMIKPNAREKVTKKSPEQ